MNAGFSTRIFACLLLAVACGDAGDDPQTPPATSSDAEADMARCPADTPPFSVGLETGLLAMGMRNSVQARIIAAEPVQPERFENDWTLRFLDASGTPADDVLIADACAFMPVHGHGGAPMEIQKTDAATYTLTGLNLFMRGPWEVQLAVRPGSAAAAPMQDATNCDRTRQNLGSDLLVFRACILDD